MANSSSNSSLRGSSSLCNGLNGSNHGDDDSPRLSNGSALDGSDSGDTRDNADPSGTCVSGPSTSSVRGCAAASDKNGTCTKGALKTTVSNPTAAGSDEDSDDDYCVYTYKGDLKDQQRLADLPSSFYQFDTSDNLADDLSCHSAADRLGYLNSRRGLPSRLSCSNGVKPSGVAPAASGRNGEVPPHNMFSPDMDFLEMDFDPSVYADPDGNDSNDGDEEIPNLLVQERTPNGWSSPCENRNSDCALRLGTSDLSASPSTSGNLPSANAVAKLLNSVVLSGDDSNVPVSAGPADNSVTNEPSTSAECASVQPSTHSSSETDTNNCARSSVVALVSPVDSSSNNSHSENHVLRLVKSYTLPELNAKPVPATPSCSTNFRPSERASILFSSGPVFRGPDPAWTYKARINTSEAAHEDSVEVELQRVMIWDVTEAKDIAFSQIGTSACGATAVLNVLRALKMEVSPEYVNECVGTRLRAETADLPQYLFSRSVAGATHSDLISGIRRASGDRVVGRFFSVKEMSASALSRWIVQWICKGAIPVVTRNLQCGSFASPQDIPDAWHHQMVFGVCPEGLFLNNPLECVSLSKILPQLQSESVLLVRRHDILSRKGPTTDLRQLARHFDPRWNDMNVLGQVANILLEEIPYFCENSAARRVRSSHIKIPAAYKAGVTLFMVRESSGCGLLLQSGEE